MASNEHNISRRQTLVGIGLAGATGLVPIAGASIAKAAQPDRSAWNAAVARLKAVQEQFARIDGTLRALHDAAEAACPRRDEFFRRFGMGSGWSRQRNFQAAQMAIVIERTEGGAVLSRAAAEQATADAYRVVDDFETWCARHDEAFREYNAMEERFDAIVDERSRAQEAVLATPAPDSDALLFKIELLSAMMTEAAAEDAHRLDAVHADARRLLTGRA